MSSKSVVFDPKDVKYPILKVSKITSNYYVYYYIRACKDFCEPTNLSEVGVESKGRGVESKGWGVESKGWGVESKGWGVESKGWGVESKGWGVVVEKENKNLRPASLTPEFRDKEESKNMENTTICDCYFTELQGCYQLQMHSDE